MFDKNCNKNWFMEFLIAPKYRLYRHLLIFTYMIVLFLVSKKPADGLLTEHNHYLKSIIWNIYFLSMFYLNMYVFIPAFLYKGRYLTYLFSLILIIIFCYLAVTAFTETFMKGYSFVKEREENNSFENFFVTIHMLTLMVFASTSIKLFQRWARDNDRINELEKNSLQIELRELKNQINPHFLFNMLNNVNVLVKQNPDKASTIIVKLSDFLRYQLYDNNQQAVLLLSEIQFLNDFLELEKIRRDDFNFKLTIENESSDKILSQLVLPPNLFTTFIENAIKHSADADNPSTVNITFRIYKNELFFACSNTKPADPIEDCSKGGLGLSNINRRLQLLYGKDFKLDIEDNDKRYTATLTLPI